ncbi:MAG: YceI family protein [Candidatus Eremiobacteraeota bacterium]|nr:YceI family protein [Candidatus Eremiobacteraeota bacterium]
MKRCFAVCIAFLFATNAAFPASQREWTVDSVHSSAEFSVKHLGFFHVKGTIPIKSAVVVTQENGILPAVVSAVLDATGVDTKNGDRDEDLRSENFLDVKRFPEMAFKSTKIVRGEGRDFSIVGELTLHGVTKRVDLNAHFEGRGSDGRGRQRIGYTATTQFDRRDFGINYGRSTPGGALVAGNDISVDLAIEAVAK